MRVDLTNSETWEDLNDALKAQLGLPEKISVKAYRGLAHAVFETCEGASNFFSHKRGLGLVRGQTPIFNQLLPGLYKDGYQVQPQVGWPYGGEKAWVEGLKKDTNFVLYSSDHPITGEFYPWQELDLAANEKKIFSVRVSHGDWLRDVRATTASVLPFSALLISVHPGLALSIVGEKVKSPSVIANQMPWSSSQVKQDLQQAQEQFKEDMAAVQQFEKQLPSGWTPVVKVQNRLFDRSLIYNESIHGGALVESLSKLMQKEMHAPGQFNFFETINPQRWNSVMNFYDWWEHRLSPEALRGMIAIDAQALKDTKLILNSLIQAQKNLAL